MESDLILPIPIELIEAERIVKENKKMYLSELASILDIGTQTVRNFIKNFQSSLKIERDIHTKQFMVIIND